MFTDSKGSTENVSNQAIGALGIITFRLLIPLAYYIDSGVYKKLQKTPYYIEMNLMNKKVKTFYKFEF